jgi:hypothetical protein
MQNGFNLQSKPPTGDLLGTTFQTVAPAVPSVEIDHTWAGADRGVSAAGYTNNTALGQLALSSLSADPFFYFSGTGEQNGLYVDLLDLSALGTNYLNQIAIDPSLVIYFAAARLSFTPPLTNGVGLLPEEYLDGQFGGHLRWVRDFAGPNSSVAVVSNGVTILVNRALRNSKIIDSDGDGTANFYDSAPFDHPLTLTGALLQTNNPPAKMFLVSWTAAPNSVYRVEFTTNTATGNWQLLSRYTNNTPAERVVSVWDTNVSQSNPRRFYRVGLGP